MSCLAVLEWIIDLWYLILRGNTPTSTLRITRDMEVDHRICVFTTCQGPDWYECDMTDTMAQISTKDSTDTARVEHVAEFVTTG